MIYGVTEVKRGNSISPHGNCQVTNNILGLGVTPFDPTDPVPKKGSIQAILSVHDCAKVSDSPASWKAVGCLVSMEVI
jgi:hypothetical protein